jgi:hypothetical protein
MSKPINDVEQKAYWDKYGKEYYIRHKQRILDRAYAERDKKRAKIVEYKMKNPCKCGESHPAALDFHHRDVSTKSFDISTGLSRGYSWDKMAKEIAKCDVICRNCHSILHWGEDNRIQVERTRAAKERAENGSYSHGLRGYCHTGNSYWKGKKLPDEVKAKMSVAHKGRKFSDEHKKALSDAHKGKKFTDEHKKNLSIAQKKHAVQI